jgi:pimeloyl-ACP methyl ester carboxylesterase
MLDTRARPACGPQRDTVICLHGSASSPRQWQRLEERLTPRFRVVAPGLIGYTDGPPWSQHQAVTLDQEAAWVERWLEGAGSPVHLVAHSYGGMVALKVAQRRPERLRSLVLYEPVALHLLTGDLLEPIAALQAEVEQLCQAGDPAAAGNAFVDYWSGPGAWTRMSAVQQGAVTQRMHKVAAEFQAVLADAMDPARLEQLPMPILLLSGALTPAPAAATTRLLRGCMSIASWIEMPGLGHLGPITHPAVVNALVALFLDPPRASSPRHHAEAARVA